MLWHDKNDPIYGLLEETKPQRDYSLLKEQQLFLHLTHKLLTVLLLLFLLDKPFQQGPQEKILF